MAIEKKSATGSTLQDQLQGVSEQMGNNPFQQGNKEQKETVDNSFSDYSSVFDFDNTGSLLGGSTGDLVTKLMTKTEEEIKVMEQRHKVVRFGVLPIDREVNQVHASAIVLTAYDAELPRLGSVAHVIIIEATAPTEDPYITTIPGHAGSPTRTISVPVMTSSVWDDDFKQTVEEVINVSNSEITASMFVISGVTVLPRVFDIDSKEDFAKMIRNVSHSLVTEIATRRMTSKLVLSKPSAEKYVAATVNYNRHHIKDAVGLPQRSDILITVSENAIRSGNTKQSLNGKLRNKREIGQMAGYIDFFWNPVAVTQQQGIFGYNQQPVSTQKYSPAFIIRTLKTPLAGVIEAQLLMLLTAGVVAKNNEWVNSLTARWSESRQESNKNRVNFGDTGVLNIEGNLPINGQPAASKYGPAINTIEDSFTQEQFLTYIGAIVRPDLQYALDMPILGAESWYMDRFLESAKGNKPQTQVIYNALNEMTKDNFKDCFDKLGGGELWLDVAVPYHTGYYWGEKDEMRDLADIDLLAVMNRLGVSDPGVGERWARTWVPNKDNSDLLLDERLSIIQDVLGGKNYVLTGWGARSFINPNVIIALGHAAKKVEFDMSFISPYNNNVSLQERTTFGFNNTSGARGDSFNGVFQGNSNVRNTTQGDGGFNGFSSRFQ